MNQATIRRTVRAFYIAHAALMSYFPLGVYLLFYHNYIGLSFTQATVLFTATWLPSMIFDLFGGAIADKHGRKRSYITGVALYTLGTILPLLIFKNFYLLIGLAVIGGCGMALASNTISAVIAEILQNDQKTFRKVNANSQIILFISRALASLIGGYLYTIYEPLPFIVFIVFCIISMISAGLMHEPYIEKPVGRTHQIALEAIAHSRNLAPIVLRAAFLVGFAYLAGDTLWAYYQAFFDGHGFSSGALGIIFASISVLSALGAWIVRRLHEAAWRTGVLAIALVVTAVNGLGFITNNPWAALVTVMMMGVISGFSEPTIRLIANEHSPSRLRSSILSVASSITSLGTILGFLVAGVVADHGSASWAGGLAVAIALGGLLLYRPARASKKIVATQPEITDRGTPSAQGA